MTYKIDDVLASAAERVEKCRLYDELIMAVQNKYEGETRHETALRIIRNNQPPSDNTGTAKG